MMNRSGITRLETRSTRANKDDTVKRVMLTVERVRKWEKKWVNADTDGCTLKIYKWVPVASDNLKQVKPMKKDNMSGISDMSTNTNSPLVLQENNLNSISCPGKQNEEMSVQQQTIVTNNSNKEPNRHSNIHQRSNKSDLKLDSNGIPSNEPKDTLNANNSGDAEVAMATSSSDVGKVIQDGDDGEDSSLAPSIASEDSTSLMYHLGINIGGENEDSRQSFQSATDSENSPDNNTKSPSSSSAPQLNIPQATTQSFDITASTFERNVSSSKVESENNEGEEPPLKRA